MSTSAQDKNSVWHPFTHLKYEQDNICLVRGQGAYLFDDAGKRYIDAISSWWVNLHGHCNSYISERVAAQLSVMEHAIFSGFTHKPAAELAERLLKHLPDKQKKIFYSDDGSTAVEVALKMTLQFWNNKAVKKNKFIAFENAYHGDTFGAMSVGARNVFNHAFESSLFEVLRIPLPNSENFEEVKSRFQELAAKEDVAGFIFEPLVQGAAGMQMYAAGHLQSLIEICAHNKIITIADEVMTGFGRTGKFFASEYLETEPDIICLSKGLTGGYFPLGVTSCADFIYQAFLSEDKSKTFFHGHSYTAYPSACVAALASLDLMERAETWDAIKSISAEHQKFASSISGHVKLSSTRCLGTILALELKTDEVTGYLNNISASVYQFFLDRGIILRPLGNVIYVLPPYCISVEDLNYIYSSISEYL